MEEEEEEEEEAVEAEEVALMVRTIERTAVEVSESEVRS